MGEITLGAGDWVWQWVRFAKNEESLKAHLRIGNTFILIVCGVTSHLIDLNDSDICL